MSNIVVQAHLDYLQLAGKSPATVYARARALARLQLALGVPLLDAMPADLTAWRAGLQVAPDTVGDYVSHVHQFYVWTITAGLLDANPAAGLPVPPGSRRLPRPISERDLFAAVAGAPPRVRPWLVLAGWAGLRAKEIALLRREYVLETARPPVLIVASDATKGRTERAVPMSQFVIRELADAGLPASGWVFRRRDGGRGPLSPAKVSHLANEYLHSIGIAATLHQLRHRFGTMAYAARLDLRLVSEWMGHRRTDTTAGYVRVSQADAAAAIEDIPVPGRLRVVRDA